MKIHLKEKQRTQPKIFVKQEEGEPAPEDPPAEEPPAEEEPPADAPPAEEPPAEGEPPPTDGVIPAEVASTT